MDQAIFPDWKDPGHSMLGKWHRTSNKMLQSYPANISILGEQAQGHKGALTSLIFPGMLLSQLAPTAWCDKEINLGQH